MVSATVEQITGMREQSTSLLEPVTEVMSPTFLEEVQHSDMQIEQPAIKDDSSILSVSAQKIC